MEQPPASEEAEWAAAAEAWGGGLASGRGGGRSMRVTASAPGASRPRTFSPLGTGSSTRSRSFSWLPDGGRGSAGGVQRGVASSQRGVSAADDLAESYKRQIDATSEILERERDMLERCTASPAYLRSVPIRAFWGLILSTAGCG